MIVSQITLSDVCTYLRYEEEYLTAADRDIMQACLSAAKEYVQSYTGLTADEVDMHENLSIAVLALTSDMYDNRQATVTNAAVNRVLESNLFLHSRNLLG